MKHKQSIDDLEERKKEEKKREEIISELKAPIPMMKKNTNIINKSKKNWYMYTLFLRKEFKECLNVIDQVMKDWGSNHEFSNYLKSLILRIQGKFSLSLDSIKICHLLNEKNTDFLKIISRTLLISGKFKSSIEVAKEVLKININDWESYYTIGLAYKNLQENEKALENFNQALKYSKNEDIYLQISEIYSLKKDYASAIQILKESQKFSVENPKIMTKIGLLYLKLDETIAGFQDLGNSIAIESQENEAVIAIGSIMQDRLDYDGALLKYKLIAQNYQNSAQLWNNIGMCFYGKKKYFAAVACLKKALYLDPFDWLISYNLGLIHIAIQQFASAFHFFSVAINLNPKFANSYMYLGICLNQLDDFENCCGAFERALDIEKNAFIYINFTIVCLNKNRNIELAKKNYAGFKKYCKITNEDVNFEEIMKQKDIIEQIFKLIL